MSISDSTEANLLNLIFRGTAWATFADNATAGAPETTISFALHTASPGDAGTMATSEANYTSYARATVNRGTGFNAATGSPSACFLAANLDFATSTGSGTTMTDFSTGHSGAAASAQPILWTGGISPSIAVGASGIIPRLTTASSVTLD